MTTYQISNRTSGANMGQYEGETAEAALLAMVRDGGAESVDDPSDWLVTATVSDEQIERLKTEAGEAGDTDQVAVCRRALAGNLDARAECARVVADAAAMAD